MPLGPAFLTVAGTGPYNLRASLNTYRYIDEVIEETYPG